KPPQSTLLCLRSPGEDLMSPGTVLGCRLARCGDGVASARQLSPVTGKLSIAWSLAVARRA
ncbi:hypothetical protein A2U01_0112602, partial [Trifolium medium]|nr:hypothetical protein [Trifolium medium]